MGNDHDGDSKFLVDVLQKFKYGGCGLGIQSACGFVTEQYLWIGGQGSGDCHSLFLSTGELCGIGFRSVCQSYDFQKLQGFCSCFGFFLPLNVQWEADVFQYVFLHEQVEMLENHSYFLSLFAEFFGGKFAEGFSVYQNFSFGWYFKKVHTSYQGTFSCTGHSDDSVDISGFNGETYVVQGLYGTVFGFEGFAHILD